MVAYTDYRDISVPSLLPAGDLYRDQFLVFPTMKDFVDTGLSGAKWSTLTMADRGSWYALPDETKNMPFRERAMDYINGGYGTNNDMIHDFGVPADRFLGEISPTVAGGAVNVPRYLAGDPMCMMAPQIETKPVDSLAITVLCGSPAYVDGRQLLRRAAAIASYIPTLLDQGISVYLYTYSLLYDDMGNLHLAVFKLFDTSQPYDAAEVFLGCGSPVLNRVVKFGYTDWIASQYGDPHMFPCYGRSMSMAGGNINRDVEIGSLSKAERIGRRVEQILPATHYVHMPDIGKGGLQTVEWHYEFVSSHIEQYLGEFGM